MNLSRSSNFLSGENKLLRLVLVQPFDEIELAMEKKTFLQKGRGGEGAEIRNQYA
jgi:hypothetical protein